MRILSSSVLKPRYVKLIHYFVSIIYTSSNVCLQLPVVAVDSYCPIVNPFSGQITGHLAVLMALGTNTQVF